MARFSDRMVPEVERAFWAEMARGGFVTVAAAEAGTYREKGTRWLGGRRWDPPAPAAGVSPKGSLACGYRRRREGAQAAAVA